MRGREDRVPLAALRRSSAPRHHTSKLLSRFVFYEASPRIRFSSRSERLGSRTLSYLARLAPPKLHNPIPRTFVHTWCCVLGKRIARVVPKARPGIAGGTSEIHRFKDLKVPQRPFTGERPEMKSGDRHFSLIHLLHERGDIAQSPVQHFVRRTIGRRDQP